MVKVNNGAVIRRLALRQTRAGRKMNIVIILSIALTCVLFTALTSIAGSLINGIQQETMRQVGGDRMAGLKCVLPEDYEKIISDSKTQDVVYRILVGNAVNEAFKNISVEVDCAGNEDAAEAMFCDPTTGRLPEGYDEIAVSTIVLDELKLPHELGISVPITLDVDGRTKEQEFRLCGYWQGERVAMAQACWVSRAFADECAPTPTESFYTQEGIPKYAGYYMVDFNYSNSYDIEGKTEALLNRLYGDSDIIPDTGINWAYTTSTVDAGMLAGIIALILVIFAAGYLIIYNIFYINISANIRSYGLLKTIGTTSRQIRRMVRVQAALYSVAGIPVGLIIGVITGRVLLGSIMRTLNIYSTASYTVGAGLILLICAVSAAFTFATVMISCRKPCRIAGDVSPIEALRYNDTDIHTRKKDKKTGRVTPLFIARNNMTRSRKKTAVVVLSLTLSIVLVNTLFTMLKGFDMDKFIAAQIVGDFVIVHGQNVDRDYDVFRKITPEQIEYFDSIDGAAEVSPVYYKAGELSFKGESLERLYAFCDKYADTDKYGDIEDARQDGSIMTDIYGVPDDVLRLLEPDAGEVDLKKWQSGKYAIVNTYYLGAEDERGEALYSIGDTISLASFGDDEDKVTRSFEVMALCEMPYALSKQRYFMFGGQVIIPGGEYFEMTDNRNAMTVMINAKENRFDDVDAKIRLLTDSVESQVMVKSKQTYLEEYDEFIRMIKLVGGALSGVVALIGILNFINAVVTGIITRKRELAMMNAVGMTGGQLKKMLIWEGVHYAAFTAFCSLLIGSLFNYFVINAVTEDMFFFSYHFTVMPIFLCVPILLILSAAVPTVAYRVICRESVVDRLKQN